MSERERFEKWWAEYRGFNDPHDGEAWDAWQAALAAAPAPEPSACRAAALEEAAKVCEEETCDQTEYRCGTVERCAAAIRALISPEGSRP